jgi:hypothetical protein
MEQLFILKSSGFSFRIHFLWRSLCLDLIRYSLILCTWQHAHNIFSSNILDGWKKTCIDIKGRLCTKGVLYVNSGEAHRKTCCTPVYTKCMKCIRLHTGKFLNAVKIVTWPNLNIHTSQTVCLHYPSHLMVPETESNWSVIVLCGHVARLS